MNEPEKLHDEEKKADSDSNRKRKSTDQWEMNSLNMVGADVKELRRDLASFGNSVTGIKHDAARIKEYVKEIKDGLKETNESLGKRISQLEKSKIFIMAFASAAALFWVFSSPNALAFFRMLVSLAK